MTANVVAFDLSLSATGVADGFGEAVLTTSPTDTPGARLTVIVATGIGLAEPADLVVVEDLPKNVKFGGVDLGMVHGAVRHALHQAGLDHKVALCPPSNLKKYATGKGTAGKGDIRMEVYKRFGLDIRDDNACDAFVLRAMGLDHLGHPLTTVPAAQRAALDGVKWPTAVIV